jgi:succinoglycan biosynthesis transport protein ExoP
MSDAVDGFVYLNYVRSRWRVVALSCLIAVVLAAGVSLLLTRQYTATARIVIEPPAGADPRSAMAVSPIYLESLKTYEQFASSDSLFQKSAGRFQLETLMGPLPIESLKKRVLKVGLVRNTRILEIAATLPDPRKAQALAEYVAEETVAQNRSLIAQSGQDLVAGVEKQAGESRARLDRAEAEWSRLLVNDPVDSLQSAVEEAGALRAKLGEQIASARLEIADAGDRERQSSPTEADLLRKEQSNARARLDELQREVDSLDRRIAEKEKLLAQRLARREQLEAERKSDQAALTAVEARLRDTRNDLSYRGERLTIIDPGVIPERPSSPNMPLNVAAAALLGLLFPLVYLALALNFEQHHNAGRDVLEALARERHD